MRSASSRSESQRVAVYGDLLLSCSSWIQKFENNNKKPNQAAEVTVEAGPSASPGGFHRLAGPLPPPVLSLFQIPLISFSRVGAHPGLRRRRCCSSGFFPLLPPPPASLPLPLHPSRAGRRGGRGHPGILIHSHCRSSRDVAFRREARPSANPPTRQRAADPGRRGGPGAPGEPAAQEGGAARSGAGPRARSPVARGAGSRPGINIAAGSAAAAGGPGRRRSAPAGFRGRLGVLAPASGSPPRPSVGTNRRGRAGQTLPRPGPPSGVFPSRALGPGLLSAGPSALRNQMTPSLSSSSSPLANSFPAGASQPLLSLPRVWLRLGQGQPVLGPERASHAAGGGGPGKAARGCARRWRGAGPLCAPPHAAACSPESALPSSSAPSGPRAFRRRGLPGGSSRVRSTPSCPRSPETALPRPLQPRALRTVPDLVRGGRQRSLGHPELTSEGTGVAYFVYKTHTNT